MWEDPNEYLLVGFIFPGFPGLLPDALDTLAEAHQMHGWEALWALETEPDPGPLQAENRLRHALDAVSAELARQRLIIRDRFGL